MPDVPELDIPDKAIDAADTVYGGQLPRNDLRQLLLKAGPLIVAAELRRLVENFEPPGADPDDAFDPAEDAYQGGLHDMRARFAARADELDPRDGAA